MSATTEHNPEYSIVVPVYNQADGLRRLLESIAVLSLETAIEVIVVDDASTDASSLVAGEWGAAQPNFSLNCITLTENRGPGHARNVGLKAALGKVVFFTDSDCVVAPNWIDTLSQALDEPSGIVGVGGRVEALNPRPGFITRYYLLNKSLEPPHSVQYLVTCNCCYQREALLSVGGFPEILPHPGGEDVAVSIALWKTGKRFAYASGAVVQHEFRDNLSNFWRTWRNYGFGCGWVAHKLLSPEERHPEHGDHSGEQYWDSQCILPTVTGIRSCIKDACKAYGRTRTAKCSRGVAGVMTLLRIVERLAYLLGWKRGRRFCYLEARQSSQEP